MCLTVPHPLRKLSPSVRSGQTVSSAARAHVRVRPVPSGASDSSPPRALQPRQAPLSTGFSRREPWRGLPGLLQGTEARLPHRRQLLHHLSQQGSPDRRTDAATPAPPNASCWTRHPGLVSSTACPLSQLLLQDTRTHSPHTTHAPHTHHTHHTHSAHITHTTHTTHTLHT